MSILIIKDSFSEEQFFNSVFQFIVSENENFEINQIPKLVNLVKSCRHTKLLAIKFSSTIRNLNFQ